MRTLHIRLSAGQKLWFTSDLHFGHRNVIRFCNRPFADVKEMDEALINNWNEVVGENDIVFVLGDTFWFNDSTTIKKYISKLNGIIYFIPGNHCKFEKYHRIADEPRIILCDDIVQVFLESEDNRWHKKILELWLAHYPLMTWPHRENGAINLFGHIHSKPEGREGTDQDLPLHKNQCDVGTDYWEYKPVQFEKLLDCLSLNKKL